MWDRPGPLNAAANALYAVSALLAFYMVATLVTALPAFALREVRIGSALTHVTQSQIEGIVQSGLRGNFFTLNLATARAAFETLPWVRRVNVRRQWPDLLEVSLEEHVPLARWASDALVNTHGEVFEAAYEGKLPVFVGPAGTAKEITIQYEYFRRSLAAIGQALVQVRISPRRAWQLKLESGLTLELGREQIEVRLARFVAVYGRTLGRLGRRLDYADLRYANGFAVRIPELRYEKEAPVRARRGRG